MAKESKKRLTHRELMELAIAKMRLSRSEPRPDGKSSPKVGAVLISPDGEVIDSSYRGELRYGDHAEFTLIDKKKRDKDLSGYLLFTTLEPCAPGSRRHPKMDCAERIVNARIKKVWVGIEDPHPLVDRKGIKFLMESGVEVEMFDKDLQDIIEKENKDFLKQAILQAHETKKPKAIKLTSWEKPIEAINIDEFSQEALKHYIERAKLKMEPDSPDFLALLEQQQIIQYETYAQAESTNNTTDEFRRNDVMPYFVWSSGSKNGNNLSDTFRNNGDRANILSHREYEDNKCFIQIKKGYIERNQEWNISVQGKNKANDDILLSYHIDLIFQDKDKRSYKQEISRQNGNTIIHEPELIQSGRYKPTGLGILLFGKNPRLRFPQAVLKMEARYGDLGPEIQDFDNALVLIPDRVEDWLKKVLSSRISREKFARSTEYDFPIKVLREVVINALVHRDYDIIAAKCYFIISDNEIVVKSPGLPISPIKFEDFKNFNAPSLSRNPQLMAVFSSMEYVEERGIGMREMKLLPKEYNLPLPIITWEDPFLTITFSRSKNYLESLISSNVYNQLNEEERKGLLYLNEKKEISKAEYAAHFEINDKKAQRHLSKFKRLKLVKTKGKSTALTYLFLK